LYTPIVQREHKEIFQPTGSVMRLIVPVAVPGFSIGAFAAGSMKPGLWEVTMKSDETRQTPNIPPAQLEQLRKNWA
jgi:hypothetical protein